VKTIVILSTEGWGNMMLSKMHFAAEMAHAGDRVFFVEPPTARDVMPATSVVKREDGVTLIRFREIPFRLLLRNKAFGLYQLLTKRYINTILNVTGPIDELWCFDPNNYSNLSGFDAKHSLLLLYDFFKGKPVEKAVRTADLVVSVSKLILDEYKDIGVPTLFVQHGLSRIFAKKAESRLHQQTVATSSAEVKIGYVGNLLRQGMNTASLKQIILEHPDKEFHFWGAYEIAGNNLMTSKDQAPPEALEFVEFLKGQHNVKLHGAVKQHDLSAGMFAMDAFLFIYDQSKDLNKASNAHKLMEYFSTGKAIVATFVSNYQGANFLYMTPPDAAHTLPALFSEVVMQLSEHNQADHEAARIRFALENTYINQISKIRAALSE